MTPDLSFPRSQKAKKVAKIGLFVSLSPPGHGAMGSFASGSDLNVAAAFLACAGKEAVTLRAYSQSFLIKLI